jgi:hypothetical protein
VFLSITRMIYKEAPEEVEVAIIRAKIDLLQKLAWDKMKVTKMFMDIKEQLHADICELCNTNKQFDYVVMPLLGWYHCALFKVTIIVPLSEQNNTYFTWLRNGRPLGDTTVRLLREAISKLGQDPIEEYGQQQ